MKQDKHTPAPWKWRDAYDFGEHKNNKDWNSENFKEGRIVLVSNIGEIILREWASYADDAGIEVSQANARLIAASPDLLEALEILTEIVKQDHPTLKLDNYYKLIKEAKGE